MCVTEKLCKGNCNTIKPLEEFGIQKLGKYGRRSKCHICRRIETNEKRNTTEGKAARKAWRDVNKDRINEQKRSPRQRELENIRRRTPENKAKRSAYKKSDQGRIINQESKRRIRQRFIDSLIEDIVVRDMDIENPYVFYHFEINGIYKFGITKYGVEYRYRGECEFSSLKCVHEYIVGEREARDIEKIVSNKTRGVRYFGDSPFKHTGITELRTEDPTKLVESLIDKLNIKLIVKLWK